jgi:hypothetical protein
MSGAISDVSNILLELGIDEIKEEPGSDTETTTAVSVSQDELADIKQEFPVTFITVKSESEVRLSCLPQMECN